MRKLFVAIAMVLSMLAIPSQAHAVTNCVNNHVTLHTGQIMPQHGTVYYRDCNNLYTKRWFEVYKVKGTFTDGQGNCRAGIFRVAGGKLKFHLNSNGKSYEPVLYTKCVKGKTYWVSKNIDSVMGRTYPWHSSFGITFWQRNLNFPDPKILKTGHLV